MPKIDYSVIDFSPHLFWDVKPGTVNIEKHQRLIVERVIQRGSRKDLSLLQHIYREDQIRRIIKEVDWLNEKNMAFVQVYFGIPLNELQCYTKRQSARNY